MNTQKIIQTLHDADCTEEEISAFLAAMEQEDKKSARTILDKHRRSLLDQFHHFDACIGCLDYFVVQMERGRV